MLLPVCQSIYLHLTFFKRELVNDFYKKGLIYILYAWEIKKIKEKTELTWKERKKRKIRGEHY